jgi:hypothetical protein
MSIINKFKETIEAKYLKKPSKQPVMSGGGSSVPVGSIQQLRNIDGGAIEDYPGDTQKAIMQLPNKDKFLEEMENVEKENKQRIVQQLKAQQESSDELQKKLITELNENVNDLNQKVIKNQIECTNRIIERENEILLIVNEIENYVKKPKKSTTYRVSEIYHGDTIYGGVVNGKMMGTEIQLEKDEKLIRMVQKLKTNCKKSN